MSQQIQVITLILAAFCNLVMSITISFRGWKNPIYKYFSLMTFFNVLWALGLLIFNLTNSSKILEFFGSFVYAAALLVVLNLFYFSMYFPFKIFKLKKNLQNILTIIISISSFYFIFFYKNFIVSTNLIGQNDIQYNGKIYLIYTILLLLLMFGSVLLLLIKYFKAEKMFRFPVLLILLGVIFGVLVGGYFNLLAMYFGGFDNYHLGPLFTLVINFMAFYLIFSKRDKQIEY